MCAAAVVPLAPRSVTVNTPVLVLFAEKVINSVPIKTTPDAGNCVESVIVILVALLVIVPFKVVSLVIEL